MTGEPEGDRERARRVRELFDRAFAEPPSRWEEFVRGAAGADVALADEVLALLRDAFAFASEELRRGIVEAAAPGDTAVPETIGPYRILGEIGAGGMGVVYRARRADLPREVAIKLPKVLHAQSRSLLLRFEKERRLLAAMNHRGIARLLDLGTLPSGQPWLAMEYLPGKPLTRYCDDHALDVRARIRLFLAVCDAVQHAHARTVVHRDLKPDNVLVVEEDGQPVPKILDFGLAKLLEGDGEDAFALSHAGDVIGTPLYGAPEQLLGRHDEVDTRCDVFALGVILYELLVGTTPIAAAEIRKVRAANGVVQMMRYLAETVPPRPSQRLRSLAGAPRGRERQVSGDLDRIVMQAMAKEPAARYQTVQAFAEDLGRFLRHEPVQATPPRLGYLLRRFARRHVVGLAVGATIAAAGSVAGLVSWSYAQETERSQQDMVASNRRAAESDRRAAASDAALLLQAAGAAYRDGDWSRALVLLDRAVTMPEVAGEAAAALRIRTLLASEQTEAANAALARLAPDVVRGSATLTLCAAELAAQASTAPEAGRELFAAAVRGANLEPADAAYARAQLAPDVATMERELRDVLRFAPNHLLARRSLMASCMLQGRMAELRQLVAETVVMYPADLFSRLLLPWSGVVTGDRDEPTLPASLADDPDVVRVHRMLASLPRAIDDFFGAAAAQVAAQQMHVGEPGASITLKSVALAGSVFQALAVLQRMAPTLHFALPLRSQVHGLEGVRLVGPLLASVRRLQFDPAELAAAAFELHRILPDPVLLAVALGIAPELKDPANLARWRSEGPRLADACRLGGGPLFAMPGGRRLAIFAFAAAMHYRLNAGEGAAVHTGADGEARSYADDLRLLAELAMTTPGMTGAEVACVASRLALTDRPMAERLFATWELRAPRDARLRTLHSRWLVKLEPDRALALAEEAVAADPDDDAAADWLDEVRKPAAGARDGK